MEGRRYRARSLSKVADRGRASSVDPLAGVSRARDDEFRKLMYDKVNRVQRSLSVRPDGSEGSRSYRHYSFSGSSPSTTVYLPVKTSQSRGLILPRGGSVEYWPTTATDPDRLAVRYGSVQPETLQRRYVEVDKLMSLPAVVTSRRRVIDEADDVVGRGNRISALLQQLKTVNGPQRYYQQVDELAEPNRAVNRAEVDSFAALLGKVPVPMPGGISATELRHRQGISDLVTGDDFWSRLAYAGGDLQRVEGLASKTFRWNEHPVNRTLLEDTLSDPIITAEAPRTRIIEFTATESPKEIFTFFNDRSVGINQTESAADQAVRWAQQRRMILENELEHEKQRDRYNAYNLPRTISVVGHLSRPRERYNAYNTLPRTVSVVGHLSRPRTRRIRAEEDDYLVDDVTFVPPYVPTAAVRRWSTTSRGRDRGTSYIRNEFDIDASERPITRTYVRSLSASNVKPDRTVIGDRPTRYYQTPSQSTSVNYSTKGAPAAFGQQPTSGMSDVRRKVRQVLAKSKGDPHYFDHRIRKNDGF